MAKKDEKIAPNKTGSKRDDKGRFLKGTVPNPSGRPVGTVSLVHMMKLKLQEEYPEKNKGNLKSRKTYAEKLIETIFCQAVDTGDQAQIKNILQYVEGMPKQPIDLGNADGKPFEVNVTVTD